MWAEADDLQTPVVATAPWGYLRLRRTEYDDAAVSGWLSVVGLGPGSPDALTPEAAAATKVLAANQGLYNGFLAAGLFWGIWLGEAGDPIKAFFLLCVAVAGVFGSHGVSIRTMEQEGLGDEARLIFITHTAREADMQATLRGLRDLDVVDRVVSLVRVVS